MKGFLTPQKVSKKGQVCIPKEIRDRINMKEGDLVAAQLVDDGILFKVCQLTTVSGFMAQAG